MSNREEKAGPRYRKGKGLCGIVPGSAWQPSLSPRCGSHQMSRKLPSKNLPRGALFAVIDIKAIFLALEGFVHEHESYNPDPDVLHWLHIAISNAKSFILGTYHGLPKDNLQSYLDEFCFRFSRRSFHFNLIEHLIVAVGTSVRLN